MSLQRRLLLYLLICAPLVWGLALYVSISRARSSEITTSSPPAFRWRCASSASAR